MCTWSSYLLHGKFEDLLKCPRGTFLETHSMDVIMNVDGVFSGHYLVDGRTAFLLLATLLRGSHLNPGNKEDRRRVGQAQAKSSLPGLSSCSCPREAPGCREPGQAPDSPGRGRAKPAIPSTKIRSPEVPPTRKPWAPLSHSPSQATSP